MNAAAKRPACITIDLDSLYCYQNIYGLPADDQDNLIYETGLERFIALLDELGLRATLFVVGRDLGMGGNRAALRQLAAAGHEIANHSYAHDYRLSRLSKEEIKQDLTRGKTELEQGLSVSVTGFRAPGYTINRKLLEAVEETGHRYDSSVFPCVPYYAVKAAALTALAVSGRPSHSILSGPQVLVAPRHPYHPDPASYWRRADSGIWEFPISTAPALRIPFLGSFLILMGERRLPTIYRLLKTGADCPVLELHGMDFMDGVRDALPKALHRQPDVTVPWEVKERLFRRLFEWMARDFSVVPLCEAVERLESGGP